MKLFAAFLLVVCGSAWADDCSDSEPCDHSYARSYHGTAMINSGIQIYPNGHYDCVTMNSYGFCNIVMDDVASFSATVTAPDYVALPYRNCKGWQQVRNRDLPLCDLNERRVY